jgi:hypothetical protein
MWFRNRREIENEGWLDKDMVRDGRSWLTSSGEAEESHGTCKVPSGTPTLPHAVVMYIAATTSSYKRRNFFSNLYV